MLEFLILYAVSAVVTLSAQRILRDPVVQDSAGDASDFAVVLCIMLIHPVIWAAWILYWFRWVARKQ